MGNAPQSITSTSQQQLKATAAPQNRVFFDKNKREMVNKKAKGNDIFEEETLPHESSSVSIYSGDIKSPSEPPTISDELPDANYSLQYAYGYRYKNLAHSIYYLPNQKVLYTAAALGIIKDLSNDTQTFFGGHPCYPKFYLKKTDIHQHTGNISALTLSYDMALAATGQEGDIPIIYVWKVIDQTMVCLLRLPRDAVSVKVISIAPECDRLACIDDNRAAANIYVYSIKSSHRLFIGKLSSMVIDIMWTQANTQLMLGVLSTNKIEFWDGNEYTLLADHINKTKNSYTCMATSKQSQFYVGSAFGHIRMWQKKVLVKSLKLANASITALCCSDNLVICGYADFSTKLYDAHLKMVTEIKGSYIPLSIDYYNGNILIGQNNGIIKEYAIVDNAASGGKLIACSHTNDVYALAVHDNIVLTSGDDNQILMWNYKTCKQTSQSVINSEAGPSQKYGDAPLSDSPDNQCSRAISISKNKQVAIACNSGEIQIRKSITDLGLTLTTIKASDKWINSMRYSPNGDMLAVGTQVGEIKLYEASKYTFVHTFNDQKVYIASMDWSIDGKYLRTNNGESVLKIYSIAAKEVDNTCGESTKDSEWATQSCKIAWNSLGVLLPGSNHSFINSICISHANDLLITGDDSCLVNIFNNPHPTYSLNSYISLRGHSNHVKRVELSNDDEYLFSIGDCSLLQWKRSKK